MQYEFAAQLGQPWTWADPLLDGQVSTFHEPLTAEFSKDAGADDVERLADAQETEPPDHADFLGRCSDGAGGQKERGEEEGEKAPQSVISSARARSEGGSSRPSARAALRLRTNSNLVGCSIGSSPGLAPFRILST